ncbi:MAG: hypothetical protein IJ051_06135, partial [Clostridia bacterium]|nr:hypothetical protein [Clostridia bacterium]
PKKPELGTRTVTFSRELYIEQDDFMIEPAKKYRRFYPAMRSASKAPTMPPAPPTRPMTTGTSPASMSNTTRRARAARLPTAERSRAPSTGSTRRTVSRPKSGFTTGSSTCRTRRTPRSPWRTT